MMRQVEAGSGYASQMMLPVHFGLGAAEAVEAVEICWPSGLVQRIEGESLIAALGVNRMVRVEEGRDLSDGAGAARPLTRPATLVNAAYKGERGTTH
ncbi:MAG: ASPIC/UnbV domain-containing protein [Acidobacteria bacterium]|nr:ASPIC/UnbV domain-containing protein [Acidobacteriota bacterium]